ncbi:uncharacterized protein Z520_11037 [Fonsecaea multimorphosa CBS 102226]|uniref:DJ-1/PfpI domain-containing protein n=1 Tax=Fonsecaea multimorphosa CBS 102226 TaxID=1442371 RepID=A0A0D2K9W3_9EURO|nr:uncharacterized protein Z520_11037 [Fonsecaea multimorphosa CBS 102226]KIX93183.1 hypothetical protein Z520_11037 [Fonsecaea multimorphosa CBS 102226]OAL18421.1 hypothetical protein AYO22_10617 [Fonsecaea multimorphosa]
MTSTTPTATSLRVGILLIPPVQLLDASAIDLFGMLTPEYLEACGLPKPLADLAIPVEIHYIAATGPGTHASMTSSATLPVTDSLSSPAVQPGQLDTLLIPGPDPNLVPEEDVLSFLRAHKAAGKTDFLVICTGSFAAGHAGLLDGKRISGPRGLLSKLREKFPAGKFVERRWERDGRIWSSGGITNGLDLTAAYLHYKVQKELADLVCAMAEVGDRAQDYDSGKASNTLWWMWLILRSLVKGKSKGGNKHQQKED